MADAVKVTNFDTPTSITVHLTNISDGTGEAAALKVDRSTLTGAGGATVTNLALKSARWAIQGFTSVQLLWNHTADDVMMVLCNSGYEEFPTAKRDPNTSGDAVSGAIGDVLLTTVGNVVTSTYDITLTFDKG